MIGLQINRQKVILNATTCILSERGADTHRRYVWGKKLGIGAAGQCSNTPYSSKSSIATRQIATRKILIQPLLVSTRTHVDTEVKIQLAKYQQAIRDIRPNSRT